MGYRQIDRTPKPPSRNVVKASTPSSIIMDNGTVFHIAYPCWYLEVEPATPAIRHSRAMHDHLGWPNPGHPDNSCQDSDFANACRTDGSDCRKKPCLDLMDMRNTSPIHLLAEGYANVTVELEDEIEGLAIEGWIDETDDWNVYVAMSAQVPAAESEKVETDFVVRVSTPSGTTPRQMRTDTVAKGRLVILPAPVTGTNPDPDPPSGDEMSYLAMLSSSNGTLFEDDIQTTLGFRAYRNGVQLTASEINALGTVSWYKDRAASPFATGHTVAVMSESDSVSCTAVLDKGVPGSALASDTVVLSKKQETLCSTLAAELKPRKITGEAYIGQARVTWTLTYNDVTNLAVLTVSTNNQQIPFGTTNAVIGVIPPAYRPAKDLYYQVDDGALSLNGTYNSAVRIWIAVKANSGNVTLTGGAGGAVNYTFDGAFPYHVAPFQQI